MKIQGKKERISNIEKKPVFNETIRKNPAVLEEKELMERISKIPVSEIPIDLIKSREINNFILSNIEELANSIERIGQQQEVILTTNEQGEYVCVAGHRRLAAIRFLRDKYVKAGKQDKVQRFSYIRARVLNSDEKINEEAIYLETNTTTRTPTIFEALLGFNIESMDFNDEKFLNKYLAKMYGKNGKEQFEKGIIKDKLNQKSLVKYLTILINESFPSLEPKDDTVKKYYFLIRNACPELIKEVLNDEIKLPEAIVYSRYSIEDQREILKGNKPQNKKEKEENSETIDNHESSYSYDKAVNYVFKTKSQINEICNYLQSLNKKNMTGNEKEMIKKIKDLNKLLSTISDMPKH